MKPEDRVLLLGAVAVVSGRTPKLGRVLVAICDELDVRLREKRFFEDVPFECLDGIVRLGLKDDFEPIVEPIDGRFLPFSLEINAEGLSRRDSDFNRRVIRDAVVEAVEHIAKRFSIGARLT